MIVKVEFRTFPDKSQSFLTRVRQQARDSLELEEECRCFDVAVSPEDPCRVLLWEVYDSRASFDAHLQSAHFKAFDAEVRSWVQEKIVEFWDGPL